MKGVALLVAGVLLTTTSPFTAAAQSGTPKSRAAGFFAGGGIDGASIVVFGDPNVEESGGGAGVTIGYGFSPHWSLYTQVDASSMTAAGGGEYSLAHFDLGTRVHFRAGPHRFVPFLQIALTARASQDDVAGASTTSSGGGISLGTGLNAHFTPALAFSSAVMWTLGTFDEFKVGDRVLDGSSVVAGSTRVHLGLVWFPRR